MKNECKSDHLVLTLEDDISDQVLKSRSDEDPSSGSSSVALWIKSLKENVVSDDSSQEYHGYTGSSSDQDDLQLGAEATNLRKKHRTRKYPPLSRDSDSDSSNNRWHSWTGRRAFLTNILPHNTSLDSDTSGLSSVTSVSSLLTARESDPEDVLKGLGFRGPSVLDKIPDRFIHTGTICEGVDSEEFLCSVQENFEDTMFANSEVPPWVMARFNDIPGKFWKQREDPFESTDAGEEVSLISEPSSVETKEEPPTRPPKTFPSKFGTYLEPVTEEVELSSQGNVKLGPINNASFESTRSTLKANSQDGPENMAMIPSLSDLWQTKEIEGEVMNSHPIRSEDHEAVSDDTGESIPASSTPREVDQGYNGDWIDKNRDVIPVDPWRSTPTIAQVQQTTTENTPVSPWSSGPAIADSNIRTLESIPAITSDQWCTSETDSVPALSAYLTENYMPVLEDYRESMEIKVDPTQNRCVQITDKDKLTKVGDVSCLQIVEEVKNLSDLQTPKHPILRIPTVTISEPAEKTRKISTINAPDIDKLLPLIRPGKTSETNSSSNKNKTRNTKPAQLNLYACQQWTTLENKRQPQIQFLNKGKPKGVRKVFSRSRRPADNTVTVSVSQCRKAEQVLVPSKIYFASLPCFSDLVVESCQGTGKTCLEMGAASTGSTKPSDDFKAPFEQTEWNFHQLSGNSMASHGTTKRYRNNERQDKTMGKDVYSDDCYSSRKEDCLGAGVDSSKIKYDGHLNSGIDIEEKLDGLQNSLKGVKMYKAGIHLMQLASSVETLLCSEKRPKRLQARSSDRLLDSIQEELKHLEKYILRLQKQLKEIKKEGTSKEETYEEVHRRGSDFSDITRQLLQEQLKLISSISSAAVSPTSSPSVSRAPSLCSETPDVLRHTDVMKLRKEMQQLRQDSVEQSASMKEEILGEVRSEIRKCFQEFLQAKSP